jgi:hypothetical protein
MKKIDLMAHVSNYDFTYFLCDVVNIHVHLASSEVLRSLRKAHRAPSTESYPISTCSPMRGEIVEDPLDFRHIIF